MADERDIRAPATSSGGEGPAGGARAATQLPAMASTLASSVAGELARPLRALRESLGQMVETIDLYMSKAPGPTPYPWKSLHTLRQELAEAYLDSRELARLASDLHDSISEVGGAPSVTDVNRCVEAALHLARHRIRAPTEVFIDLGSVPPVHAVAGELVLCMTKLLFCCADSAAAREGSAISIRTFGERGGRGAEVIVTISDNGAGLRAAAAEAEAFVLPVLQQLGGTFGGVSEPDQGSAFSCHLPAADTAADRVASAVSAE